MGAMAPGCTDASKLKSTKSASPAILQKYYLIIKERQIREGKGNAYLSKDLVSEVLQNIQTIQWVRLQIH